MDKKSIGVNGGNGSREGVLGDREQGISLERSSGTEQHWWCEGTTGHRLASLPFPPPASPESRNQAARLWGLRLWGQPDRGHGPYKTGNNTYIYILYTETQSCRGRGKDRQPPEKPEAPAAPPTWPRPLRLRGEGGEVRGPALGQPALSGGRETSGGGKGVGKKY